MYFIESLCPPALLYLIYSVIHIALDLSMSMFMTAIIKVVMGIAGVIILDALCGVDLGVVSWAIVATPFIMVALATSISLGLGLDRAFASVSKQQKHVENMTNKDADSDALPLSSNSMF